MMMMKMMMMMMSERRHVRDVLRTFFFDLLSGRDTHKKKSARFSWRCFWRTVVVLFVSRREKEREMKMANWIDEKLHK